MKHLPQHATHITCGDNTLAVIDTGELYMCGSPELHFWCLGLTSPPSKQGLGTFDIVSVGNARLVASGTGHSAVLGADNKVRTWGYNFDEASLQCKGTMKEKLETGITQMGTVTGQLGHGDKKIAGCNEIAGIQGKVKDICCGPAETAIITDAGVHLCGSHFLGTFTQLLSPTLLNLPVKLAHVACGMSHVIGLAQSGEMWSWGSNRYGQLGHEVFNPPNKKKQYGLDLHPPDRVYGPSNIAFICCGFYHNLAIDKDGRVLTWGNDEFGQLGLGQGSKKRDNIFHATYVERLKNKRVVQASCGRHSSAVVSEWGNVYVWGELAGEHMAEHCHLPRRLDEIQNKALFVGQVACGISHIAFLVDSNLSNTLSVLNAVSRASQPLKVAYVKELLSTLSPTVMKNVQDRVHAWLEAQTPGHAISVDTFIINFSVGGSTKMKVSHSGSKKQRYTKGVRIMNSSNALLELKPVITASELYQSSHVHIDFDPAVLTLEKRQTGSIRIIVSTDSNKVSDYSALFSLYVTKPESKSLISQSKRKHIFGERPGTEGTRYFFLIRIRSSRVRTSRCVGTRSPESAQKLLKHLSSYVPHIILNGYARNSAPPQNYFMKTLNAAILFIDISGFTALNERLAKLGPAGPEQVSKHLNSYFGQLIEAVYQHGGDVLKFAGDALICMFTNEKDDLYRLSLRALQCGMEIQTSLAEVFPPLQQLCWFVLCLKFFYFFIFLFFF